MIDKTTKTVKAGLVALTASGAFGSAALADSNFEIVDITNIPAATSSGLVDYLASGNATDFNPRAAKFTPVNPRTYNDALPSYVCFDGNGDGELDDKETDFRTYNEQISYDQSYVFWDDGGVEHVDMHRIVSEELARQGTALSPSKQGEIRNKIAFNNFDSQLESDTGAKVKAMVIQGKDGEFEAMFVKGKNGETLALTVGPDTKHKANPTLRGFCYLGPKN